MISRERESERERDERRTRVERLGSVDVEGEGTLIVARINVGEPELHGILCCHGNGRERSVSIASR